MKLFDAEEVIKICAPLCLWLLFFSSCFGRRFLTDSDTHTIARMHIATPKSKEWSDMMKNYWSNRWINHFELNSYSYLMIRNETECDVFKKQKKSKEMNVKSCDVMWDPKYETKNRKTTEKKQRIKNISSTIEWFWCL